TRVQSDAEYGRTSRKTDTETSSSPPVDGATLSVVCVRATTQSLGTDTCPPRTRTTFDTCGGGFGFDPPPQPAASRTQASTTDGFHGTERGYIRAEAPEGKDRLSMAKTTDKVLSAADNAKPYVDAALHDEDLRENVKAAFTAAREIYDEL